MYRSLIDALEVVTYPCEQPVTEQQQLELNAAIREAVEGVYASNGCDDQTSLQTALHGAVTSAVRSQTAKVLCDVRRIDSIVRYTGMIIERHFTPHNQPTSQAA